MAAILTVDDSRSIRDMVRITLEQDEHEVIQAEDGVEALERARKRHFDLVLTDMNMPKMGGLDLIRELRELEEYRFTPMLVLTTESGGDAKGAGKAAGATGWLVKPFDPERLLATIKKVLG